MNYKLILILALSLYIINCQKDFYSLDDYRQVKKIDAHTHIYKDDINFMIDQARKDNFRFISVNVEGTKSDAHPISAQLHKASKAKSKHPNYVNFAGTFSINGFNQPDWSDQQIKYIDSCLALGAIGIKVWKTVGMQLKDSDSNFVQINDKRMAPILQHLTAKDVPLIAHIGEPKNCWLPVEAMTVEGDRRYFENHPQFHMYMHQHYPKYEEIIAARDDMLAQNPQLKVIGCHLGSLEWSVDELAKRLDIYPNLAVDLAARICHLQYQTVDKREKVRNFMVKYQDRLLYGTDLNSNWDAKKMHQVWFDDWKFFVSDSMLRVDDFQGQFKGLKLPKTVINKLYYENAFKWCQKLKFE